MFAAPRPPPSAVCRPDDPALLTRRAFARRCAAAGAALAGLGACAPAHAAPAASPGSPSGARARPLGLQLYTVRAPLRRDFEGTLAAVAAAGYAEVEFAGYHGHAPAEVRRLLERHGLAAPASHVPWDRTGADWAAALAEAAAVGHRYAIVPWLPESARGDADGWRRTAERLDRAGRAARAAGLRFGYHNHDFELRPLADGSLPLDLLMDATDPAHVVFELDLYWLVRAGQDPAAWLARRADRVELLHVKDSAGPPDHRMVDVGAGTIDFATLLPAAVERGVRHLFVEHDDPADPLASMRASARALQRVLP
jgi:sugar phosphate isomerase/epimerase